MPEQQLVEIACALSVPARASSSWTTHGVAYQKETHLLFAVVRELRKNGVGHHLYFTTDGGNFQLADRVTVLRDGKSIGSNRVGEMTNPR